MSDELDLDDEFGRMAEEAEKAEAERAERRNSRGSGFSFERVKWTGLEPKKMKILRFLGAGPDLGLIRGKKPKTAFDARVVRIAKIIDDKGKQMRIVLPRREDDENFILWRIIDRINEVDWVPDPEGTPDPKDPTRVKNIKVFVNQKKYPDVFNIVNFSNLPESDPKRKFGLIGKGWEGREVLIANVIDRELMAWHRENKHTILLSKNVNLRKNPDGSFTEFVDEGVPAFGFTALLNGILGTYKYWGKYDIGIERTGQNSPAYKVYNVSRTPEVAPKNLQVLISNDPTTIEEESWIKYDLDKLFGVTSYTKLWNRLHLTIEMIDAKMGTKYAEELKKLANTEAAIRVANKEAEAAAKAEDDLEESFDEPEEASEEAQPEEEKVVERRPATKPAANTPGTPSGGFNVQDLLGYEKLTATEKRGILEVSVLGTEATPSIIKYTPDYKKMAKCPTCNTKAPAEYQACPGCGETFVF